MSAPERGGRPFGAASVDMREAQWATKAEVLAAIKTIGWQATDASRVDRMGFQVWVIADPHGRTLSIARYSALATTRAAALRGEKPCSGSVDHAAACGGGCESPR